MENDELLVRHLRLRAQSAELRSKLSNQVQVFKQPLGLADQGVRGLQWLYHHPQWPLATLAVLVAIKPRRAVAWGGRLWWTWKTTKQVGVWVAKLTKHG